MYQDNPLSSQVDTTPLKPVLLRSYTLGLALTLVILLGVMLRFLSLGDESFYIDEIKMISLAQGGMETITEELQINGRPPVYVFLAYIWVQVFGTSEWATRSLSALAGSLALGVFWLVGRELLGRRVAVVATLLMALSEFQIKHSQDFRYYAVFLLLVLCSFLFYIRAIKSGNWSSFAAYVLASVAMCYTHPFGVFVLVAQALHFVLHARIYRPLWSRWLLAQISIGLGLLPFVLIQVLRAESDSSLGPDWIPTPPLWMPAITIVKYILPGRHLPAPAVLGLTILVVVLGLTVYARRRGASQWLAEVRALPIHVEGLVRQERNSLILLVLWVVFPILVPFVLSKIVNPMYLHRYTIAASPAVYLLLALLLVRLRRVVPEVVTVGALILLITPGLYDYYVMPTNEQWREAAAYIEREAHPDDVIVFAPAEDGALRANFFWYYQGVLPVCELDVFLDTPTKISAKLNQCSMGKERLWLIMRGSEERLENFSDYFLRHEQPNIDMVRERPLRDLSLHLFNLIH